MYQIRKRLPPLFMNNELFMLSFILLLILLSATTVCAESTEPVPPCLYTDIREKCIQSCECTYCKQQYYGLHCIVDDLSPENMTHFECVTNSSCSNSSSSSHRTLVRDLSIGTSVACVSAILFVLVLLARKSCKFRLPTSPFRSFETIDADENEGL